MDRDVRSWSNAMISEVAQECQDRGYHLAVSNPCFELWLLLHFEDVPRQDDARKQELAQNANGLLKKEVTRHCSANRPDIDHFLPHSALAVARAEALDTDPEARWLSQIGTRVYRLVRPLCPPLE